MINYIIGKLLEDNNCKFISNDVFGIQVNYEGHKAEGEYFLYPYIDDNKKTVIYFAFDNISQKIMFESALKISGVGTKTAFQIAQLDREDLRNAVHNLDTNFFEAIPGIGPKSAKKILFELKSKISLDDIKRIDMDEKLYKKIVSGLKGLGYEVSKVKSVLKDYPEKVSEDNISEVIKWVIGRM